MTHSFDNTLLQRMGFKDPDRRTPEHDKACIEIACWPDKLCQALGVDKSFEPKAMIEVPLQKGEGKYATTVGFIDAMVSWSIQRPTLSCSPGWNHRGQSRENWVRCDKCEDRVTHDPYAVLVEVKTSIESIGDLLRQMNLYREYKRDHGYNRVTQYVVWSLNVADDQYVGLLASQGYTLIAGPTLADAVECSR